MLKVQRKTTGQLGYVLMRRTQDGKLVPYEARVQWLKRLCKRAGVEQFGFHGIRHLLASILASKNVPPVEIQKMLRHGSIQTIARYIHTLQEGAREALALCQGWKSSLQERLYERDSHQTKTHRQPALEGAKAAVGFLKRTN